MKYLQRKSILGSEIKIEIETLDTGFNYSFLDKTLNREERTNIFFNYSSITNNKENKLYKRQGLANSYLAITIVIYFAFVVYIIYQSSNTIKVPSLVDWGMKNQAILSYGYAFFVFLIYKFFIQLKMIRMTTTQDGFVSLLKDKSTEKIIEDIKTKRNAYLRNAYLKDDSVKIYLTQESVDWLYSLLVIDQKEYNKLREYINKKNEKKGDGVVGFNKDTI